MRVPNRRDLEGISIAESATLWLQASLMLGAAVGLVVGLVRASQEIGFAVGLGIATLIGTCLFWLGAGLCVALSGLAIQRALSRWLGSPWRSRAAAMVAIAPWLGFAGYTMNRWLGIRPSQLLTGRALPMNVGLALFALGAALWLARRQQRSRAKVRIGPLVALLLVVLVAWATRAWIYREAQQKPRPDVLVLLIDALRADHVGAYGYARDTTPTIDRLAEDGVRFASTIAASTFTKSSIASLFTGRYPYEHGVYWGVATDAQGVLRADVLSPQETTVAEQLRDRGYLTEGWVQNGHLRKGFGFAQGFVHYRDSQGSAPRIQRHYRRFLRGPGQRYPYFAYLHLIDLHDPYQPPATHRDRFGDPGDPYAGIDLNRWGAHLAAVRKGEVSLEPHQLEGYAKLYDAQLSAIDDEVAQIIQELVRKGRYDDTLIVITSDHGDAFGEHGVISHSTAPYDELIRVPWIIKLPQQRFAGTVIEEQVSLVDLLPTLLDALGMGASEAESGCSRWLEIRGGTRTDERCSIAITEIAEREGEEATIGLRTQSSKYLRFHGGREEFYDLRTDPGEQQDLMLSGHESDELLSLRNRGYEILAARHLGASQVELDDTTLEELRALGYLK